MSIKITITQNCDSCSKERDLIDPSTQTSINTRTIEESSKVGGWREVKSDKHLCPTCINKALGV